MLNVGDGNAFPIRWVAQGRARYESLLDCFPLRRFILMGVPQPLLHVQMGLNRFPEFSSILRVLCSLIGTFLDSSVNIACHPFRADVDVVDSRI